MATLRNVSNLTIQEKIVLLQEIVKGGQNINIQFCSFPKLRKEFNGRVKKTTCGVCSMKKDYRNLKINEGRTDFEGLYGGSEKYRYVIPNLLIEKNENGNVSYLLRVYPHTLKNVHNRTIYEFDGVEITKQELIDRGILKDKPHTDIPCFNVKLENLMALGKSEEE
jgi:hypothetical protein